MANYLNEAMTAAGAATRHAANAEPATAAAIEQLVRAVNALIADNQRLEQGLTSLNRAANLASRPGRPVL